MGTASSGTPKKEGREFQSLLAASLISRFEKISEEEVYEKASRCFDFLLDVWESPETAKRLALLIDRGISSVQHSVGAVIDLLLFNRNNDPYVSLGLPRYAGKSEVKCRWKRLIVMYHPDKYPNQREYYEEKAKKINEAYEEIRKISAAHTLHESAAYAAGVNTPLTRAVHYPKYLKHVPTIILALVILIALVSILFFINTMKDIGNY